MSCAAPRIGGVRGAADAFGSTSPAALPSRALLCSCSEAPAAQSPLERHRPAARAVSGITGAGSWNETGSDSCFHEGYEASEVSARRAPTPPLCSLLFGTGVSRLSLPWVGSGGGHRGGRHCLLLVGWWPSTGTWGGEAARVRRLSHAEDPACCYESRDEARLAEISSSSASPHLAVHPSQLLCVASEGEKIKKKISAWKIWVAPLGCEVGEAKAGAWYAEHGAGGRDLGLQLRGAAAPRHPAWLRGGGLHPGGEIMPPGSGEHCGASGGLRALCWIRCWGAGGTSPLPPSLSCMSSAALCLGDFSFDSA